MSKTQQNQLVCEECGQQVSLARNARRELQVSCACEERSVKVSKATPLEWSA